MKTEEEYSKVFNDDLMEVIMDGKDIAVPLIFFGLVDAYCFSTFGMIQSIDFTNIKESIENGTEYDLWVDSRKVFEMSRIINNKDYLCILDALYDADLIQLKKVGIHWLIKINYKTINQLEKTYTDNKPGKLIIKKKSRTDILSLRKIKTIYKD